MKKKVVKKKAAPAKKKVPAKKKAAPAKKKVAASAKKKAAAPPKKTARPAAVMAAVNVQFRAWCDTEVNWISPAWTTQAQANTDAQPHIDAGHLVDIRQKVG